MTAVPHFLLRDLCTDRLSVQKFPPTFCKTNSHTLPAVLSSPSRLPKRISFALSGSQNHALSPLSLYQNCNFIAVQLFFPDGQLFEKKESLEYHCCRIRLKVDPPPSRNLTSCLMQPTWSLVHWCHLARPSYSSAPTCAMSPGLDSVKHITGAQQTSDSRTSSSLKVQIDFLVLPYFSLRRKE